MSKPISGKNGNATFKGEVLEVRTWTITDTADNQSYNSSRTKGQTRRVHGVDDWTGSVSLYFQDGRRPPNINKGDIGSLVLKTSELIAGKGETGTGEGIVDSIVPETDVEGGTLIGAALNMSADGAMTFVNNP